MAIHLLLDSFSGSVVFASQGKGAFFHCSVDPAVPPVCTPVVSGKVSVSCVCRAVKNEGVACSSCWVRPMLLLEAAPATEEGSQKSGMRRDEGVTEELKIKWRLKGLAIFVLQTKRNNKKPRADY